MKFRNIETDKTLNLANSESYIQTPKFQLISLLLTSFLNEKYYSSGEEQINDLVKLVSLIDDKKFLAKAAIFARREYGMRSITHVLAGELASTIKNEKWLKDAIAKIIYRPDDILEIVGYYKAKHAKLGYKKGLSAALRKGIAKALLNFDEYQLAKYKSSKSAIKLVDILNLVHPKPNDKQSEMFKKLINGELKSTQTWEAKLSKAGHAETEEIVDANKKEAWIELITNNKLGYFALLRNLRNIMEQAPEILNLALAQLMDVNQIKKSLVLPFRFLTAIDEINKLVDPNVQQVIGALHIATEISMNNVPEFPGKTLIALDTSGSMNGRPMEIGSLFASALYKKNADSYLMLFNDKAEIFNMFKNDSVLTMTNIVRKRAQQFTGGTNFDVIFNINQKVDRIIIISDMQNWVSGNAANKPLNVYKARVNADPLIHSFDLAGHGTLQFPEKNIYTYAGFSEKIFDVMKIIEQDKNALINKIEQIDL